MQNEILCSRPRDLRKKLSRRRCWSKTQDGKANKSEPLISVLDEIKVPSARELFDEVDDDGPRHQRHGRAQVDFPLHGEASSAGARAGAATWRCGCGLWVG